MTEQDLNLPPSQFLPAQLLQQKLLSYQQNEGDKSVKTGKKASASFKSNELILGVQLSSIESNFNEYENQDHEKDDDDDVTIPGEWTLFSCTNEMFH